MIDYENAITNPVKIPKITKAKAAESNKKRA
jgi:hypothetical protein